MNSTEIAISKRFLQAHAHMEEGGQMEQVCFEVSVGASQMETIYFKILLSCLSSVPLISLKFSASFTGLW